MEVLNANAVSLSNYEVMKVLQQIKDNTQKKYKKESSLATVTYETLRYLQDTEAKNQNEDRITKALEALKPYKLTKIEKLMVVNTPPRSPLEIQLIVQDSEERLTEKEVEEIIGIVAEAFPVASDE